MSKQFLMLVGLPASGKSTYRETECSNYAIVSSDDFIDAMAKRDGITYNEAFTIYIKDANASINSQFEEALASGKDIVWDQTNLSSKKRISILDRVPAGYIKTCVVFSCDPDLLKERLMNRPGKNIPEAVINTMQKSFEYPTSAEGFDYVMQVGNEI